MDFFSDLMHCYQSSGDGGVWLDARGDGSKFVWQREGLALKNDDPLWWFNHPEPTWVSKNHCLILAAYHSNSEKYNRRPYMSHPCSRPYSALCEGKQDIISLTLLQCIYLSIL